jgi:hypothetical protein
MAARLRGALLFRLYPHLTNKYVFVAAPRGSTSPENADRLAPRALRRRRSFAYKGAK